MRRRLRTFLIVAFIVWMGGWFWAFSFAYSSSFFKYHLGTRLPFLVLALVAVTVPPLSGYWAVTRTLRRKISVIRAVGLNLGFSGLPLSVFWVVHAIWLKLGTGPGRSAFEADEAMGVGIDFLLCLTVFVATNGTVMCILALLSLLRRGEGLTKG